jgi:hypothetical protein
VKTFDGFGVLALASVCPITAVLIINMTLEFFFPKALKSDEYIEVKDMAGVVTHDEERGEHVSLDTDTELLPTGRNISNYGTTTTTAISTH